MSDDNRIDCLNYIFNSNISIKTKIEWLNRKSVKVNLLEIDFVLKAGDDLYHAVSADNGDDSGIRAGNHTARCVG